MSSIVLTAGDPESETKEQDCFLKEIRRLSDEELRAFITKFMNGQVFNSNQIMDDDFRLLASVFMPLAFGLKVHPDVINDVGMVWEYLDQAQDRGINGYPTFFSCNFMHKEDCKIVQATVEALRLQKPFDLVKPESP